MTRKDWDRIRTAAELLELGEKATLAQIKKAYRRLSKKHHPDLHKTSKQGAEPLAMQKLNEAYQTLMRYCGDFCFPLIPGENDQLEGEDWWFERFGQDHHWGKGSVPRDENGE